MISLRCSHFSLSFTIVLSATPLASPYSICLPVSLSLVSSRAMYYHYEVFHHHARNCVGRFSQSLCSCRATIPSPFIVIAECEQAPKCDADNTEQGLMMHFVNSWNMVLQIIPRDFPTHPSTGLSQEAQRSDSCHSWLGEYQLPHGQSS